MRSLTTKLVLAFLGVSLVGIALVAILAGRFTESRFRGLLNAQNQQALITELAKYYRLNDGWEGIEAVTTSSSFINNFGRGFIIIDTQGKIVNPDPRQFPNLRRMTVERIKNEGVPIVLDGQVVGMLIPGTTLLERRLPVQDLFSQFYRTLFIGALGAMAVSLMLGVILARTLTRSLRELTAATQAVAQGGLGQQVPIRSQDELGELAESFNQMSADLSQASDSRRQMTADIAHELRTPLSVILGHTEALSEGQLPPDPETFHILHDETQRLSRLVDDLRTLSLSDAGELHLERHKVPPQSLIEGVVAAREPQARRKNIELKVELETDLPDVEVDPDRMTQVLGNLLDNALRYTPEGGSILLSAQHSQGAVVLIIQDSGPGIPTDDLPHVFDRLYRGDKSRHREEGGSGLGLAIAKSLVESQDGSIRVESQIGSGATFIIKLPV